MNAKIFLLTLSLISLSVTISAQSAFITFRSNTDLTVRVNRPVDKTYNPYVVSDILELKPNKSITHKIEVKDFCSVKCKLSTGNSINLLLTEGDSLEIENINNEILFRGKNAEGNQYLYDRYWSKGLSFYYPKIESILKKHITKTIDFEHFDKEFQDSIVSIYSNDILKLKNKGKISYHFAEIMTQNLRNAYSFIMYYAAYKPIMMGKINGFKLTVSDSKEIRKRIDMLHSTSLKTKNPLGYYYTFPYIDYYIFKYSTLDAISKEKLTGIYDKETFNYYARLLLAPDSIQRILFSRTLVSQLQNLDNNFDSNKMLKYLYDKSPQSEYISIIKDLMIQQNIENAQKTNMSETPKPIFLNSKKIESLKELANENSIKGNRIYIDLWATFCMPCKIQFEYKNELHKLLTQYKNLVQVYISIDEESEKAIWKKQVTSYDLSGFHIIASKILQKDIQKRVYKNKSLTVPRYLLIDSTGNIINNDLPRPDAIDKLKEVFDKELK